MNHKNSSRPFRSFAGRNEERLALDEGGKKQREHKNSLSLRAVLYVIGFLLLVFAFAMLFPMLMDIIRGDPDWQNFVLSFLFTGFAGGGLILTCYRPQMHLSLRQTFLLTGFSWIIVAGFVALPFYFSDLDLSYADAYFEAMSGLTTTGATILTGLDTAPPGILLWRSLIQWIGALGIVFLGIVILPFLRVGGMQLFHSESSDNSDKVVARVSDLALSIGGIYVFITIFAFIALKTAGMSGFDALNHSLTSASTGGFSTRDQSIGYFDNAVIEYILIAVMISSSLPFVRYISVVKGRVEKFWQDSQIRTFFLLLLFFIAIATIWHISVRGVSGGEALRLAAFNVTSILTTTGYASSDYNAWGSAMVSMFFLIMFIGGCTGSTSGGIKIFRFEILFLALRSQLVRLFSPRQVKLILYQKNRVSQDVLLAILAYLFVFFFILLAAAAFLAGTGLDFLTALSASASTLTNVGPGLGNTIGPAGNFSSLEPMAKWVLSALMLLGRLEFFTLLVLLMPDFWHR